MAAILNKTVSESYGDAFNYKDNLYNTDFTFCKKFLIFCSSEYSTENLLFILVCNKYAKSGAPSWVDFNTIYNEFVKPPLERGGPGGAPRQVNISDLLVAPIKLLAGKNGSDFDRRDISNLLIFEAASDEIRKVVNQDTLMRFKQAKFVKAFVLDDKAKKDCYDSAIACLKSYGINLTGA